MTQMEQPKPTTTCYLKFKYTTNINIRHQKTTVRQNNYVIYAKIVALSTLDVCKKNAMNLSPSHCLLISLAIYPLLFIRYFRG
jgi:hypothetical protein